MLAFIPLGLTWFLGILISFLFSLRLQKYERIAIGFLLGIGFQTWMMFIFYLLGWRFTLINWLTEWLFLYVLCYVILYLLKRTSVVNLYFMEIKKISWTGINLFRIIVSTVVLTSLIIGLYWPVIGWDSLALYDFRAITFLETGGMEDGIARGYFFGYPLLTSLAHTWIYMFGGNPHVLHWLFYISFLIGVYYYIKNNSTILTARLVTLLLALLPSLFQMSFFDYTNLPYLVYIVISFLYLDRWFKSSNLEFLVIAFLFTGFSTWTRMTEPFWLITILFSLLGIFVKMKDSQGFPFQHSKLIIVWLLSLVLFFAIQQPWRIYESLQLRSDRNIGAQVQLLISFKDSFSIDRAIDVILSTYNYSVSSWQPALNILIVLVLLEYKSLLKHKYFLGIILSNIFLIFFGTYLFSLFFDLWKHIIASQIRLSNFMVPLIIIMIGILADKSIVSISRKLDIEK